MTVRKISLPLLISLFICLTGVMVQAQTDYSEMSFEEKLSFDLGIGVDHSIIGIKVMFRSSEKFDIYTGIGVDQLLGLLPVLGVQYNFLKSGDQRFVPYLFGQFGKDLSVTLNSHPYNRQLNQSKSQKFYSSNFGVGVRISRKVPSKFSFNVGVSYRILDPEIEDFVDDFNSEFMSDQHVRFKHILPILGIGYKL